MATTKRKGRDWLRNMGANNTLRPQAKATLDEPIICGRHIRSQPYHYVDFVKKHFVTSQPKPSYLKFDKESYPWKPDIDYRKEPEKYRVGKGEQGVLICEPYKSELIPHWRFKTPEMAEVSSTVLYKKFESSLEAGDFVGADLARKFLQMGYTRARRYANYQSGIKYDKNRDYALKEKGTGDPLKAESAAIFYQKWKQAEAQPQYASRKQAWCDTYG